VNETGRERFFWAALGILGALTLAAHVLGAGPLRGTLWGSDGYGFLPPAAWISAAALLAAGVGAALMLPARREGGSRARAAPPGRSALGVLLGAAALALLFWRFREGHTLLGDGGPLTSDLPRGQRFHPHEPLTYLIHHVVWVIARRLFEDGLRDPVEVARATVGLSSVIAGALFVPVAWALGRELLFPPTGEARDPAPAGPTLLVFAALLAQGYVQLFFGYVENYTFSLLVTGLYLLLALRHVRGASPLALPGLALVLGIALDLSTVALAPSFLVLVGRDATAPGRRAAMVRDLAVIAAFGAGLTALLAWIEPGYRLPSAAGWIVLQALIGHGHHAESWRYMWSAEHVRDFLNEQMLIGPAAAFLLLAATLWLVLARPRLGAATVFLLVAGLVPLAGAWLTTDLSLGYARDWDLFAPSGLVFTAAGLAIACGAGWRAAPLRRWLALLVALSLVHTGSWVAVNASLDRSFARLKTLPLGLGRTEALVGAWYVAHGDTVQAVDWLRRSLDANPANSVAAYYLGSIGMARGLYPWAARAFLAALEARPDKELFRFRLVDALIRGGGRPEWAKPHLDTLLLRNPGESRYWQAAGVVWLGLGRRDSAEAAFARADRLAPGDSVTRALMLDARASDAYARAVRERWPLIAGP
jgi:tetratricopeptide (TPR) repeat protein